MAMTVSRARVLIIERYCCGLVDVRFAPNSDQIPQRSDMTLCGMTGNNTSLNHFVGADEQRWRYFNPQQLCGFEIDDRLILGGCLHR
jgi:hypothetical protein